MLSSAQGHELEAMASLAIAIGGLALLGFAIPLAWLVSGPALVALGGCRTVSRSCSGLVAPFRAVVARRWK